jgi:hypothetical protein
LKKHHDSKYCHPTICPGSCFGYFKTNWASWEQACPYWCAEPTVVTGPVVMTPPPVATAPAPVEPAPAPKALPPVAPDKEPMKESSQLPPVTVPKPVTVPAHTAYPALPPVPELPIGLPPAPPTDRPSKS